MSSVYKPKAISGFPEWLPEERLVEQQWFDHIRRVFESYGFCSIETPSVEELDVIRAKGEVDKEIYVLERLHKEEGDDSEARLALHFDQTVPLARYVAQHFNELIFPFKRYQIQRVWRGERPQAGRFREFYQCDIDVINVDALPLHFDAEMPAIIWEVLSGLPGMENEKIQLRISNRKILIGYFESLGKMPRTHEDEEDQPITEDLKTALIRVIDKMETISGKGIFQGKINDTCIEHGYAGFYAVIEPFLKLCKTKYASADSLREAFKSSPDIDTSNPMLNEGINELETVMANLKHLPEGAIVADLSIVRGLDYYTGTVYETVFTDDPGYGSICSGGRYDDLASSYINKSLPGVGISIGFSRLFDRLRTQGKFDTTRKSTADVLMLLPKEEHAEIAARAARTLRERGLNVEMYHKAQKIQKQFAYAEKKGIPYVWLPDLDEVKCMAKRTQVKADPETWTPEEEKQNAAVA